MATSTWDSTYPVDATAALVDDHERVIKVDVVDTFLQGGHFMDGTGVVIPASSSTSNHRGKHVIGIETQDPLHQDDSGYLTLAWEYHATAPVTPYLRVYGANYPTVALRKAIEALNGAFFVGPNVTSGLDPGHRHTQGGTVGGRAGVIASTGYLKPSAFRWSKGANDPTQTVTNLICRVSDPPGAGGMTIQFRRTSGAPAAGADVYDDATATEDMGTVTINASEYEGQQAVVTHAELSNGEYIVQKVLTVNGTPANLTCIVEVDG